MHSGYRRLISYLKKNNYNKINNNNNVLIEHKYLPMRINVFIFQFRNSLNHIPCIDYLTLTDMEETYIVISF